MRRWRAGRGGQKFIERCVPKVAELRKRFPQKDIEVDGGIAPDTIAGAARAGANVLVAIFASFLLQSGLEFWFSDRARTVLEQAEKTAAIYEGEHRVRLTADMEAMGTHIGLDPNQSTVPN